ncbi:MAG: winged helix-turn-helix domain-containing protein [Methylococcaceae bacterium]|nr:winged helix-turn-helix domain-containing protein [Methylococcaceae bacterium]
MLKKLQVLFVSDNQYATGIFKGYFHALDCNLVVISDCNMFSDKINGISPDLIFLDFDAEQGFFNQDIQKLLKQYALSKNVPICGLSGSHAKSRLDIEFDEIFSDPIDVTLLDKYICRKFERGSSLFASRKNYERRNFFDRREESSYRRVSDNEVQNNQNSKKIDKSSELIKSIGPFQIDNQLKCVYLNSKLISLTCKEFKLFEKLANDVDRVISDEEIIDCLWPGNSHATKADLHQYMHLLRKKIEDDPKKPMWITTVKGFGYRLLV